MTKKHFEAIAAIIADAARSEDGDAGYMRRMIARDLAALFKDENPRFDTARFLVACDYDAERRVA